MKISKSSYLILVLALSAIGTVKGKTDQPREAVSEKKEQVRKPSKSLHLAAAAGDIEQVRVLLSNGSDVDLRDKNGGTLMP